MTTGPLPEQPGSRARPCPLPREMGGSVGEERFASLLEQVPVPYHEVDGQGIIRRVNRAECRALGYEASELIGHPAWNFVSLEEQDSARETIRRKLTGTETIAPFEQAYLARDGSLRVMEVHECLIRDEYGAVAGMRSALLDVTGRKRAEEARRESEERYALAMRGSNDGLWDWNLRTGQIYFSPRWKSMLGCRESEVGSSEEEWFGRVHAEDLGRLKMEIALHLEGHTAQFENEHRMRHQDGTYRWMLSRGTAVIDGEGQALRMAGSLTDITARKVAEERLLHDAFHDELTGLPNRALFMERLERAALRAMRRENYLFAVLFLDLDRFKVINDSLGHLVGDQLLVGIARRLAECLRPEDTVARLGGDEFVVLCDDLKSISDATHLAERIQKELKQPFQLDPHEVFTTASIGIALNTTGFKQPEDLLRNADTVMYQAKALGKARYEVYRAGMHTRALERLRLETDLRVAVERHEFLVHYQPIVSRMTGEICALEALARWQHPYRGLIPPDQFVAVAEETGIMVPIDDWVLRAACAQAKSWQAAGLPPVRVAVNLSARQFKHPNLVDMVTRTLEETGLDPRLLELELTEGVLHDVESTIETLERLCGMGVRISIDDFGTGYCSLKYLLRFPINTLKIDGSFIQEVDLDDNSAAIASAVITLGHSLKVSVVAECVERPEQLEYLRLHGCDLIQGNLFSRPVAAAEAAVLLARRYLTPADRILNRRDAESAEVSR